MSQATNYIVSLIKGGASKRLLNLYFPRDDGPAAGFLVTRLEAEEEISRDFEFRVTVVSDDPNIALKEVQCKMVAVELLREDQSPRYFNGYCHEFVRLEVNNHYALYQMTLRPWLAFFRLRSDYWIFQHQNIHDQSKEIFNDLGLSSYDFQVREPDAPRTFSVQYDETDYNYLHRRWEEMGWHYHYEHSMGGHKLILSSNSPMASPVDGNTSIAWHHDAGSNKHDKIKQWQPVRSVVSGKVTLTNFDFKKPDPSRSNNVSEHQQGDIHQIELYQYLGLYGAKDPAHAKTIAERRMEQADGPGKLFDGAGDCRRMQPGRWFKLAQDHAGLAYGDDGSNEFLILRLSHTVESNLLNPEKPNAEYQNEFQCIRRVIPWRPKSGSNSVPTRVPGLDTAIVIGPPGQEIHTDKYGRIKVKFHWDRNGKGDGSDSCWVRVMTPWANKNFGIVSHPRIGTEVVIQYLHGDPDKPVVVGQFYNERHMPPWSLPANQTQSGILTRSSKDGTPDNANALRFEDKKGQEEVWLHAEKDQRIEVENDESHWVGHDRSKTIDHDETVHVKHDRTETVDHDEKITVHNNRTERVDHDEKVSIGDNRQEDVGKNSDVKIGQHYRLEAGDSIELICGKSRLRMDKDGHISINGHEIILGATGEQFYKADGDITIKAKNIKEN